MKLLMLKFLVVGNNFIDLRTFICSLILLMSCLHFVPFCFVTLTYFPLLSELLHDLLSIVCNLLWFTTFQGHLEISFYGCSYFQYNSFQAYMAFTYRCCVSKLLHDHDLVFPTGVLILLHELGTSFLPNTFFLSEELLT